MKKSCHLELVERSCKVFAAIAVVLFCVSPFTTYAQYDPTQDEPPQPSIQIPGFAGFSKISRSTSDNAVLVIPYIPQYLAAFYKWAVGAGAVIAAFMITIGGFQYVASAGVPKAISSAKKRITNALIGFLLLLGSYVFLYAINPDFVNMKSIELLSVPKVQLDDAKNETDQASEGEGVSFEKNFKIANCPDLVSIDGMGLGFSNVAHRAMRTESAAALKLAIAEWRTLEPSRNLTVQRDYRTTAEQQYLYDGWIEKKPGFAKAAKPGKSNHERGNAIDLTVTELTTAQYVKLITIMNKHGFEVLGDGSYSATRPPTDDRWKTASERWHFDYTKDGPTPVIECTNTGTRELQKG